MTAITFNYNTDVVGSLFSLIVKAPFKGLVALHTFYVRAKAEAELAGMDNHMLADIGISRGEIHNKVWGV